MRYFFINFYLLIVFIASAQGSSLPSEIFSGYQGRHHVQGVVVDTVRGEVYFSFTTRLVKTDLNGTVLGSVDGLTGHLGCLTRDSRDGRIYGSIEYKDDAIGVGIAGNDARERENAFYIAVFDPEKITRPDMRPTDNGVMKTVYLREVVDDYYSSTVNRGRKVDHRFGCSGIDGVAFGPKPASPSDTVLYVAYGIYGDTTRTDNDYQVILAYDTRDWGKYEQTLEQARPHHSGPERPAERYFVRTGNTSWGIQNLEYDPATNTLLAAVYPGKKSAWPNYSLFAIDLDKAPESQPLKGFDNNTVGKVLPLRSIGLHDVATDTYGWHFPYGATGLCSLGDGRFYISHNSKEPEQSSTLHLYRWTGSPDGPFAKP